MQSFVNTTVSSTTDWKQIYRSLYRDLIRLTLSKIGAQVHTNNSSKVQNLVFNNFHVIAAKRVNFATLVEGKIGSYDFF